MSAIGLSADVAQVAIALLSINILLGLLMSTRYSPWRYWPHRRINLLWWHNQTGLAALAVSVLHPILILFSKTAGFHILDIVFPLWAPKQPNINLVGAAGLYTLAFVVITSLYRKEIGRRRWKAFHYATYGVAGLAFIHGILANPHLNSSPVNFLDGGKLYIYGCLLVVLAAILLRVRYALAKSRSGRLSAESVPEGTL